MKILQKVLEGLLFDSHCRLRATQKRKGPYKVNYKLPSGSRIFDRLYIQHGGGQFFSLASLANLPPSPTFKTMSPLSNVVIVPHNHSVFFGLKNGRKLNGEVRETWCSLKWMFCLGLTGSGVTRLGDTRGGN